MGKTHLFKLLKKGKIERRGKAYAICFCVWAVYKTLKTQYRYLNKYK